MSGTNDAERSRIVAVDVKEATLDLIEPFAIAGGAPSTADVVFVRVRRADEVAGYGEAAPFTAVSGETQAQTAAALRRAASAIVGTRFDGVRAAAARLRPHLRDAPAALGAIEQALFDLAARRDGVSLREAFGGAERRSLETDVTITAGDEHHAEESTQRFFERGFRIFKIKCGAATPERDATRVARVARAAPGSRILLDANGGYTADEALELLDRLDAIGIGIDLFEQPVHRDDQDGMARIHHAGRVTVCADESVRTAADALHVVRHGLAGAINVKVMKSGVLEAIGIWHVARAAGLSLMIGGMVESPMAMAFSAHLALGLGGFTHVDLDTPLFLRNAPVNGGLRYEGAHALLVEGVGHGASLPADFFG